MEVGAKEAKNKDSGREKRTILINGIDSRTRTLVVNRNTQKIYQLISQISKWIKIPEDQIRCICNNRALSNHRLKSLEDLNIQDATTIYLRLRLKGGATSHQDQNNVWKKLSEELKEIPEIMSATKQPDIQSLSQYDNSEATSQEITQVLEQILQDQAQ